MKREDLIIIYLSALLALTQWYWMKAEKRAAYLEGRWSVYQENADNGTEINCYAPSGCDDGKHKRKAAK